jgi:hypothetical protein
MCTEANTVLRAVAADFFFNCFYVEIPSDNRIRHVPRWVRYLAQGFRKAFYVGSGVASNEMGNLIPIPNYGLQK